MGVESGDVNCGNFCMNSPTVSEAKNHNSIYSIKKWNEMAPNIYEMENTG